MLTTYDANGLPLSSAPLGYTFMSQTVILQGTTTYTVPSGTRAIMVECMGGGGGSGGVATAATNSAGAGGGGGGEYARLWIVAPKLTAYTVAVGAGGIAGTSGANTGGTGGSTTFDSPAVCTAIGGSGGVGDTIAAIHVGGIGGVGGTGGTGDFKVAGMPGGVGLALAAAQAVGGAGGDSLLGHGGAAKKNATAVGTVGQLYGGGASGSIAISAGASQAGVAGGNGVIIVSEYA